MDLYHHQIIAGARNISRSLVPRMRNFFARSRIKLSTRKQPGLLSPVLEESGLSNMFHLPSFHRHSQQDSQRAAQPPAGSEDSLLDPRPRSSSAPAKSGRGAGPSHGSAINKCVVKFKSLLGRNKDKDTE